MSEKARKGCEILLHTCGEKEMAFVASKVKDYFRR